MTRKSSLLAALVLVPPVALGGWAVWRYGFAPAAAVLVVKPNEAAVRQALPVPSVRFVDVTKTAGIDFRHENGLSGRKLLPETMGGGVVVIDYDNDGRQDLFFVNSCPWPGHGTGDAKATSKLYRNKGDGTFADVTVAMGLGFTAYGMGACVGDFDNDGFADLFVTCIGKNRLFRNDGGKAFLDVTSTAGVTGETDLPTTTWDNFLTWDQLIPFGTSATFLDYDGDGRLDLFVCRYVSWSPKFDLGVSATLQGGKRSFVPPREFDGTQCLLYRNVDGKSFVNASEAAGIQVIQPDGTGPNARKRGVAKSLGVVVCDPDEDGRPDIVVANDTVRNFFFHNIPGPNGTRRFEEIGEKAAVAYADEGRPRGGMGIDHGEYLPGKSAIVIANFANESNTFLKLSLPNPLLFTDAALAVGLAGPSRTPLKFGAFFFDFDNDGRQDLLTCNGHIEPDIGTIQKGQSFAQPAQLFWNTGDPGRLFESALPDQCGPDLFQPIVGRGAVYLDYDNDGDLDVVLVGNGGPALLLRNDNELGRHWTRLSLLGNGTATNRSAIGADVIIEAGGTILRRTIAGARGYLSQPELPIHVGLYSATIIDKITVKWPGDPTRPPQVWTNLIADRAYVLTQGVPSAK